MYESRFGITGPPFQLSPDPSFYFDSRTHHRALDELRRGLAEEAGCIVVSGEIGAGKTTLVRTLLGELEADRVVVSHVVSTQLDAVELLTAALIGFGVRLDAADDEPPASQLLRFLADNHAAGRRAVLIIDEAQNLRPDAFEPLVETLSQPDPLRFQVCLVGQPELRGMLAGGDMRALREFVRVSCHLGPIASEETGPYIEHRLRKVHWNGIPSFQPGAFEAVFRATRGIPRRINLLCNRLMLGCFLTSEATIDAAMVERTAGDLRAEIGEPAFEEAPAEGSPGTAAAPSHEPSRPVPQPPREPSRPAAQPALMASTGSEPLLCIATGHADHVKAAALMRAMKLRGDLPAARLVRVHDNDALQLSRALFTGLDIDRATVNLGVDEELSDSDELTTVFELLVHHVLPRAVIVFDGSRAALYCARVARAKAIPVIHIGAGVRGDADTDVRKPLDELADLLYTTDAQASETLADEGVPVERVHCVGNLLVDAMQVAMRTLGTSSPADIASPAVDLNQVGRNGYALVSIGHPVHTGNPALMRELFAILRDISRDLILVWPRHGSSDARLRAMGLNAALPHDRTIMLSPQPYADHLALLRTATCVLTDSWSVQEEATALGVPCLTLGAIPGRSITVTTGSNVVVGTSRALATRTVWECIFNGGKRGQLPALWDGKTAPRIAGFLGAWLPSVGSSQPEPAHVA